MNAELLRRAAGKIRSDSDRAIAGYATPRRLQLDKAARDVADWLDIVAHDISQPDFELGYLRVYDQAFVVARSYLDEEWS